MGWDRSGNSGNPGVCIHHPGGDLKKISTVAYQPLSTTMSWKVQWKSTENGYGTTEQGSSGSPLLTAEHKVIGQLFTGSSSCSNLSGEDYFRRFDISWNGNNNISCNGPYWSQLIDWLIHFINIHLFACCRSVNNRL